MKRSTTKNAGLFGGKKGSSAVTDSLSEEEEESKSISKGPSKTVSRIDSENEDEEASFEVFDSLIESDSSESEQEDTNFQELQVEEYKKEIKAVDGGIFYKEPASFKSRMEVLDKIEKNLAVADKNRKNHIIAIEHKHKMKVQKNGDKIHYLEFHIKILNLDKTPFILKEQLEKLAQQEGHTETLRVLFTSKEIENHIKKFSEQYKICKSDEISLINYVVLQVNGFILAKRAKEFILQIQDLTADNIIKKLIKKRHMIDAKVAQTDDKQKIEEYLSKMDFYPNFYFCWDIKHEMNKKHDEKELYKILREAPSEERDRIKVERKR